MILLDTNVLGRMTDSTDPQCATSRGAIRKLAAAGQQLIMVPQIMYEFWAVATRSRGRPPAGENGLGMTCNRANQWVQFFRRRYTLLVDPAGLVDAWLALVRALNIQSSRSHDARLVAAMQMHGIPDVLTFNAADFKGLPVTVIDPATV
jgi:predicted nucleic acid-binding protein